MDGPFSSEAHSCNPPLQVDDWTSELRENTRQRDEVEMHRMKMRPDAD